MFLGTLRQRNPKCMGGVEEDPRYFWKFVWKASPLHPTLGKGISIALNAWGRGYPIASGGLWAVKSLLHPVPGGGGESLLHPVQGGEEGPPCFWRL